MRTGHKVVRTGAAACAAALVLVCLLDAGCARHGAARTEASVAAAAADEFEASGLLLLMADQLLFEPFGVRQIFRERPDLHERLALVLGRIGDPRGRPYLESEIGDPVVDVRRAAAFGLGLLGDQRAYPALLGAVVDRDREVGRLAVDALARLELPLARVSPALESLPKDERWWRLLPALFRFSPDEIHEVEAMLEQRAAGDSAAVLAPGLERWLVFALARSGDARGLPRLRRTLDRPDSELDSWSRSWAARGLGRLGAAQDMARLAPLLAAEDAGEVVEALRAALALIDSGKAAAPAEWLEPLERLIHDPRPWVRLTVLEVAGAWPLAGALPQVLRGLAAGADRAAQLALGALARANDSESEQLTVRAAASDRPAMRSAAAAAAGVAGPGLVLERLRADANAAVRIAALTALLERGDSTAATSAREALLDADPAVRAVALDWLAATPVAPIDELLLAVSGAGHDRMPDVEVNGAVALAARAAAEPLERGAIVAGLERLARADEYLVRRAGVRALQKLDREVPPLGTVTTTRTIATYRQIASLTASNRFAEIELEDGAIVLELECPTAPLTCLSFLQLARAGFFDGLRFHRVISNFVAQGGDPRGDGWGGPGFSLRDENSSIPYERGVVGMARSDTHTAGCQFFLTLTPQPHLTGRYTAFGRVIAGWDFLDLIEQGDAIVAIREIDEPARLPPAPAPR